MKRQAEAAATARSNTIAQATATQSRPRRGDGDEEEPEEEPEEEEGQGGEFQRAKRKTPHREEEEDEDEDEETRPRKKRSKTAGCTSSQKHRDNIRSDIKERLIAIFEEAIPPESEGIKRKNFPSKKDIAKAFLTHRKRWELSGGITEEDVLDLKLRRSKEGMKKLKDALDGNHVRIVDVEEEEEEEE